MRRNYYYTKKKTLAVLCDQIRMTERLETKEIVARIDSTRIKK
jgi:hypothetical protein